MRLIFHLLTLFSISVLCAAELKVAQIRLGDQTLTVEIADRPAAQATGLMGRKNLPENGGMLFVFEKPSILSFWMKNTLIPLSIGFFDADRKLINTADMEPETRGSPLPRYKSASSAVYALEMKKGWFSNNQIGPGEKFTFLDPQK